MIPDDRDHTPTDPGASISPTDRAWLRRIVETALTGPAEYYWRLIGLIVLATLIWMLVH
ncbi:hypothetical protein [Pseudonocardia lacus]|uniref:hypothetical protein n=1 Tax=Pseudonocardia lacus TaxID=2835865 RepID=UPI001BDD2E82|nr:hypothetical protein [Pseudonocardia lacus]